MGAAEQFVLTVTENGYGKRTSCLRLPHHRPRRQGHPAPWRSNKPRIGPLVAAFPVEDDDQIMLVTDGGQLIRVPVERR